MIQRIQSVFLVMIIAIVATLCGISVLHLVYVAPESKTTEYVMNLFYFNKLENGMLITTELQFVLILLASIIIGLSVFILMDFKNRARQMKYTLFNLLAILALTVVFSVKAYTFVPEFAANKMMMGSVVGIALFLFMFYLCVRVYYLIKKDEELVRSADRIR